MKAVTIAKVARILIAIAVAIIIAIPAYGGLQSFQMGGTNFVETDSDYQLEYMTPTNLKANIESVIGDSEETYSIIYGNTILPFKWSDVDSVITTVMGSGEKVATLLKPNGEKATQQIIIGSVGMSQYIFTGLKLSEGLVKTITPSVTINARTESGVHQISNVGVTSSGDTFELMIEIPMVVVGASLATGANINLDVGIAYNKMFEASIQMDLPSTIFMPSGVPTYEISPDGKDIKIDVDIGIPENIDAKVGDIDISVKTTGEIEVKSTGAKPVIDSLKDAVAKDGKLVLEVTGQDPIVIEKNTADTLIALIDELFKKGVAP